MPHLEKNERASVDTPRRRFLLRGLRYGAGLAALWGLGWSLSDWVGPSALNGGSHTRTGPFDWSVHRA